MCTMSSDSIVARSRISELESELSYARLQIEALEKKINALVYSESSRYVWETYTTIPPNPIIINARGEENV